MKNTHWFALFAIAVVNISSVTMTGSNTMARDVEHLSKEVRLNLAILIFDGVQIIDYTGPYETFGHAYNNDGPLFNIYTVGPKSGAITTAMGMSVNPKYNFANAPRPDVLVVPGGDTGIVRVERANEQPNRFTPSVKVARDSANSKQPGA
jgi:putative intracellular protease/amidase